MPRKAGPGVREAVMLKGQHVLVNCCTFTNFRNELQHKLIAPAQKILCAPFTRPWTKSCASTSRRLAEGTPYTQEAKRKRETPDSVGTADYCPSELTVVY